MPGRLENQRVLVTGASGFLGGHLVERLLSQAGAQVVGLIHDLKQRSYVESEGLLGRIDTCVGDIRDFSRMREIISDYEITYVFHCAADSIVRRCVTDPLACFETNIMGTATVLEAARSVGGVRGAVCMESDKAYGGFDPADLPYREEDALNPANVYEVSKACAGLIGKAYDHNYDLPTVTIRGANLYGPGDPNTSRLIPGSILRVLAGESPVIYNGVENYVREFMYVGDAAGALIDLMERIDDTRGHAFNLGSGYKYKIREILLKVCRAMSSSLEPKTRVRAIHFKEIEEQYVDSSKLRAILPDFEPLSFDECLPLTIDWYRRLNDEMLRSRRDLEERGRGMMGHRAQMTLSR